MKKYKSKILSKIADKEIIATNRQDIHSATEFKRGLDKGKHEIGSLLFSGDVREERIIKKICTYLGYKFIKKDIVPCCLLDSSTSFDVVHYIVEE